MPPSWERVRELGAAGRDEEFRAAAAAAMADALRPVAGAAAGALFDACAALSGEPYEGGEAQGTLLLLVPAHPAVDVLLELREPIPLLSVRAARKALELSRGEVVPLSDGVAIGALGRLARPYDPALRDLFAVEFEGRGRWTLRHGGAPLLAVDGRPPPRRAPALARHAFETLARDVLAAGVAPDLDRLWAVVSAALGAGRGSTIVVSAGAPAEARRLAAQGTAVTPRPLAPEVVSAATGIGGAMLLDPGGTCHAIGAILDGIATLHGARSRGSRFNSAANYVRGRPGTLAVVVSDDGTVDLLAG